MRVIWRPVQVTCATTSAFTLAQYQCLYFQKQKSPVLMRLTITFTARCAVGGKREAMGRVRPIAKPTNRGVRNEINRIALSIDLCRARRGTVAARNNEPSHPKTRHSGKEGELHRLNIVGKVGTIDDRAAGQHDRALHDTLELLHVAGPGIAAQPGKCRRSESEYRRERPVLPEP